MEGGPRVCVIEDKAVVVDVASCRSILRDPFVSWPWGGGAEPDFD